MKKKLSIFFICIIAFICVFSFIFIPTFPQPYLKFSEIKGVELYYQGVPYRLNSKEQNLFINIINRSKKFNSKIIDATDELENIDKLVILRSHPHLPIVLFPMGFENESMIFIVPDWSSQQLFKEEKSGEFINLLLNISK